MRSLLLMLKMNLLIKFIFLFALFSNTGALFRRGRARPRRRYQARKLQAPIKLNATPTPLYNMTSTPYYTLNHTDL